MTRPLSHCAHCGRSLSENDRIQLNAGKVYCAACPAPRRLSFWQRLGVLLDPNAEVYRDVKPSEGPSRWQRLGDFLVDPTARLYQESPFGQRFQHLPRNPLRSTRP